MIIDCHAHVFMDPRIRPYPHAKTTFMSAEQQIALMDEKGIDKTVILPINNAESPVEHQSAGEILAICEKYPGRFIPFCNLDPRHTELGTEFCGGARFDFILEQYAELGFKGMGEFCPNLPWEDPQVLELLGACERVGFPVTFHTITPEFMTYGVHDELGLPGLEAVLKRFPNLKFFGHSAAFWSEISGDLAREEKDGYPRTPVVEGGAIPRLMRECPNLYGDISAGSGLSALQRDPEHAWKFIDEFQDRIMLGLDYCSTTNDMPHIEWLTQARDDGNISADAFQKIMWKNVSKALGLGLKG
ncbi:MAG: amidohydrolase family protein [Verrucomicrobiota bacterium]